MRESIQSRDVKRPDAVEDAADGGDVAFNPGAHVSVIENCASGCTFQSQLEPHGTQPRNGVNRWMNGNSKTVRAACRENPNGTIGPPAVGLRDAPPGNVQRLSNRVTVLLEFGSHAAKPKIQRCSNTTATCTSRVTVGAAIRTRRRHDPSL